MHVELHHYIVHIIRYTLKRIFLKYFFYNTELITIYFATQYIPYMYILLPTNAQSIQYIQYIRSIHPLIYEIQSYSVDVCFEFRELESCYWFLSTFFGRDSRTYQKFHFKVPFTYFFFLIWLYHQNSYKIRNTKMAINYKTQNQEWRQG